MKIKFEPMIAFLTLIGGEFKLSPAASENNVIFLENRNKNYVFYNTKTHEMTTNFRDFQMFVADIKLQNAAAIKLYADKYPDFFEKFPAETWFT